MHTVVLTELGIAVYQDDAKLYSIPFENPAEEYVAIKQQKSIPADLATRLIKEQSGVLVTDESLMSMFTLDSESSFGKRTFRSSSGNYFRISCNAIYYVVKFRKVQAIPFTQS